MFIRTPSNGSRVDANGEWSKLDYICSTALLSTAKRFEHLSQSDHAPIGCDVTAPHTQVKKQTAWRVNKNLSAKEVAEILQESAWPLKQMNRDPIMKKAMVKISLKRRKTAVVKRVLAAVNDPAINLE